LTPREGNSLPSPLLLLGVPIIIPDSHITNQETFFKFTLNGFLTTTPERLDHSPQQLKTKQLSPTMYGDDNVVAEDPQLRSPMQGRNFPS
jgi:hypothetical protein